MASWKEGDRVVVVSRAVNDEDRKTGHYFDHMAGMRGTVQNVYSKGEIAVKVDPDSLSDVTRKVHQESLKRMREKFLANVSEEQKKQLTSEELNFGANYVLLVQATDLSKGEPTGAKKS